MKQLIYLAALTLIPVLALAQNSFDEEVNAELDKMYDTSQATANAPAQAPAVIGNKAPSVQVNVQAQPQAIQSQGQTAVPTAAVTSAQTQGVNQTQAQTQNQVQKQPTTLIEAAPLAESRAEKIRKARQESELLTEQKIVEKLESSRMEDEKKRADVLFGDKFNQMNTVQAQTATVPAILAPVPVTLTEQTIKAEPVQPVLDREAVRQEITAALADSQEAKRKMETKTYFSGMAGMGDYPDVANIRGNYSAGVSFGTRFDEKMLVEGSFMFANYLIEQRENYYDAGTGRYYPRMTNMDQYHGSVVAKYQILGGTFRPLIGGVASYTYRVFSDRQFGYYNNDASSHALDLGLLTGADFEISDKFSLGLDFRYMWNLTSRAGSSGYLQSFSQMVTNGNTPVEKLSYMNISLLGRFTF